MSLSIEEIALVVEELRALQGASVQQAYAPRERVLLLELRVPGATHLLGIDATPGRTRLGLVGARPPSPMEPLPFQQAARAQLCGRKLVSIDATSNDRLVTLRFAGDGERSLVAELTGRHGNLGLLAENGVVLALAGTNVSQLRALAPGRAYRPPESAPPSRASKSRFAPGPDFAMSRAIEAEYAIEGAAEDRAALLARLERPLRTKIDRLTRTLSKVAAEAARTEVAEAHRVAGELLKTSLHQVPRGATSVTLTDYSSGEATPVTIALRAELSAADNLAWHFRQYRRLAQGSQRAAERLAELETERSSLQLALAELPALDDAALRDRESTLPVAVARAKKGEHPERKPFREFVGSGGARIRVGKGAAENDALTFKFARPHDLWLHARGRTGAHVVVALEKRAELPQELLLDACALAVHFSDAKTEPRAEVSYLPAKYLRKPKGAAPGAVIYSQEKTLVYVVEPARLARLLATAE